MTGLNFQTETIVNSADLILNKDDVKGVKFGPNFENANIVRIEKTEGNAAVPHKFTITIPSAPAEGSVKYYSLNIVVAAVGAEPFVFTNAMAKKYIPLNVEFSLKNGDTAQKVVNVIKKNQLFVVGNPVLNVSLSGQVLTLEAAEDYIHIQKCELVDMTSDEEKDWVTTAGTEVAKTGVAAFGTYSYLIKNLRLPTVENLRWNAKSEMPEVGAIYDQYIFEVEAPASNGGLHAVGQRMTSHTIHSFWVKNTLTAWSEKGVTEEPEPTVLND